MSKRKDKCILYAVIAAAAVIIVGSITVALVYPGTQAKQAGDRDDVTTIIQNDTNGSDEYASATSRNIEIQSSEE